MGERERCSAQGEYERVPDGAELAEESCRGGHRGRSQGGARNMHRRTSDEDRGTEFPASGDKQQGRCSILFLSDGIRCGTAGLRQGKLRSRRKRREQSFARACQEEKQRSTSGSSTRTGSQETKTLKLTPVSSLSSSKTFL